MPSSVFSHQAPGLALKIKYPTKFDGTALCFATFVPDLSTLIELFLRLELRGLTHSLISIIYWTVPFTIILTILFCRFFGPWCATLANKGSIFKPMRYFGIDDWSYLKNKTIDGKFFLIATYSAILGGLTHLLLDLPAHGTIELFYPWILLNSPGFLLYSIIDLGAIVIGPLVFNLNLTVYSLIWMLESIIGLIIALYLLRWIKKRDLLKLWYEEKEL